MRGEVAIGPSIYGVYVIDGSLCSRVYGMSVMVQRYIREKDLAVVQAERGSSYVRTCNQFMAMWLNFHSSVFTCSMNTTFMFSNWMPLIQSC